MAAVEGETERFYLEREEVIDDSQDPYEYEAIPLDEDFVPPEMEEDLDAAVRVIREAAEDEQAAVVRESSSKPNLVQRPEVVDDFVRNFLVRMGLSRTLDCFQTEWYELQQRGLLHEEDIGVVPDIYSRNSDLDSEVKFLKQEVHKFRTAAMKAKDTFVKLRKERDYHRMHHKRVVQEKNKLIDDIKRLKRHYSQFEPTLVHLKSRYEVAMKEKMLARLERDRAINQITGLQSTLKNAETYSRNVGPQSALSAPAQPARPMTPKDLAATYMGPVSKVMTYDIENLGPTQRMLLEERLKSEHNKDVKNYPEDFKRHPKDSEFPVDNGINPNLNRKGTSGHLARTGGFRLNNTFSAHTHPVSGASIHPRKPILATSSDDYTWKIWSIPNGDIIFTGTGHTQWVSDCSFHPSGSTLATTSGDSTVKVWSFTHPGCLHTFPDHTRAVWSCSWHSCGDFLATASMDNTTKIWDLNSARCRSTMRGHADSVNAVQFLPYSNIFLTCSADKTVSMWDARTKYCSLTFFGHMNSVNDASFNGRGDTIASCDSMGIVKLWDVRKNAPMVNINMGPHPANKVAFDPTGDNSKIGAVVSVASNDSTIKVYELTTGQTTNLYGHEDAVQCVTFDITGEFMVSGGSDNTVRIWS